MVLKEQKEVTLSKEAIMKEPMVKEAAGKASPPVPKQSPPATKVSPPASKVSPPVSKVSLPVAKVLPPMPKESPVGKESLSTKEIVMKIEKQEVKLVDNSDKNIKELDTSVPAKAQNISQSKNDKNEESSNGVGDKIKKFEKAAEEATVSTGRLSRSGSVRGRGRTERLPSDGKEDFPPPATPFKDNVHFDLQPQPDKPINKLERQHNITKNNIKWQRSDSNSDAEKPIKKPEPQKIIKPEFKPIASPSEITIRSPSLAGKIPEQFPSQGTAFRNVASPDTNRNREPPRQNEDSNTHDNIKACKFKNKEKISVSKGSSYFTRGSEEIWLVKKKDIEEIEERVLDSFRRAGGNVCMRSESMRPSSDSGHAVSFSHATMGRNKRQMYARSESLDPQWAGARSQTLKRQTSVACTCGHDKKTRAKSAGADARPRSRSHGDDNNQSHVLDKYETLV